MRKTNNVQKKKSKENGRLNAVVFITFVVVVIIIIIIYVVVVVIVVVVVVFVIFMIRFVCMQCTIRASSTSPRPQRELQTLGGRIMAFVRFEFGAIAGGEERIGIETHIGRLTMCHGIFGGPTTAVHCSTTS